MKRITESIGALGNGVTNHYTPVDNIVINVRNLYGCRNGVVVQKSEDGFGIKLLSSLFVDEETTQRMIYSPIDRSISVDQYIRQQGLQDMKILNLGPMNYVVYYMPADIEGVGVDKCCGGECCNCKCTEQLNAGIFEAEMTGATPNPQYEVEIHDTTHEEICKIIKETNKIEAAEALSKIINKKMTLPKQVYIKATKDAEGNESVALRYKFERPRPFNKTSEAIVSLVNIYDEKTVWVGINDKTTRVPRDIMDFTQQFLNLIGATPAGTDDCSYVIEVDETTDDDDKD